ncbi:CUAEP/CCAEP-tail radical SAM (seleno)protein [Pseudomonadota bacterium]
MKIVLISPYEIGRQPFSLAHAAAYLNRDGFDVTCFDLSLEALDKTELKTASVIGIHLAMHTATRIAAELLPKLKEVAPLASFCVYGLYAPLNAQLFFDMGVERVFGGESEPDLVNFSVSVRDGFNNLNSQAPQVSLDKIEFLKPQRNGLPPLQKYAHLITKQGEKKTVGFVEASRGCKHLCRHCPVVPIYQGKFRIVPMDIVLQDIQQQVAAGAEHISFGDPDFLNGPTHAVRIVEAMHNMFPNISYDMTVKIQHINAHADLFKIFADTGCRFVTSAVESLDNLTLQHLDKQHTVDDFYLGLKRLRSVGIDLAPTFVPFTPWTTAEDYVDLLSKLVELDLVANVPPIQLAIRLLIPRGSYLLQLEEIESLIGEFDHASLGYPWKHSDPAIDELQIQIQSLVERATDRGDDTWEIFSELWALTHRLLKKDLPPLPGSCSKAPNAQLSEVWYCCAEPTSQQLLSF